MVLSIPRIDVPPSGAFEDCLSLPGAGRSLGDSRTEKYGHDGLDSTLDAVFTRGFITEGLHRLVKGIHTADLFDKRHDGL